MSVARRTRKVAIGRQSVGGDSPVVVQSMCATKTRDIDATVTQIEQLAGAGAGVVRIAVDNDKEVTALKEIRTQTEGATLSVDLQENYRLAATVGPYSTRSATIPAICTTSNATRRSREGPLAGQLAGDNDCAIRIGVNCGSVAPEFLERFPETSSKRWCSRPSTTATSWTSSTSNATSCR